MTDNSIWYVLGVGAVCFAMSVILALIMQWLRQRRHPRVRAYCPYDDGVHYLRELPNVDGSSAFICPVCTHVVAYKAGKYSTVDLFPRETHKRVAGKHYE